MEEGKTEKGKVRNKQLYTCIHVEHILIIKLLFLLCNRQSEKHAFNENM